MGGEPQDGSQQQRDGLPQVLMRPLAARGEWARVRSRVQSRVACNGPAGRRPGGTIPSSPRPLARGEGRLAWQLVLGTPGSQEFLSPDLLYMIQRQPRLSCENASQTATRLCSEPSVAPASCGEATTQRAVCLQLSYQDCCVRPGHTPCPGPGPARHPSRAASTALVPHASGMSCGECDQAQLTHLRADVGPPPTGPEELSQDSA
ncbi:unnamed protein product [Rangifer tarandus platyrhynchus]|uniref:Uncharacterized protein n=1 Tax=Rangifer tarandus platyrhynchus TaxID=3082113 RepID=A0ABN8Y0K6_RANTA|nr:unnamed protein product [Rangifer tarandus platyrhynchus]